MTEHRASSAKVYQAGAKPVGESATFSIGRASARALIAGLYLLRDHAHDGWDNPGVLEVGEEFTDLEPPTDGELKELIEVLAEPYR